MYRVYVLSNRRRRDRVDAGEDDDGDESTWAGTGAHPTASRVTSQADEIFVRAIHLCGNGPAILIGAAMIGDSGYRYLADDALENLNTAREVVSIHYERRENTQSVLSGGECQQTFPSHVSRCRR
jgi:hypothetical protein